MKIPNIFEHFEKTVQLSVKNAKTCDYGIERLKNEVLKRIPVPESKMDGTIRFAVKFYIKNKFQDFFEKMI